MTQEERSLMLEATLNTLVSGIFLVGRDGRILHMNSLAEHFLKTSHALHVVQGKLTATDRDAAAVLAAVLASGKPDAIRSAPRARTIALPRVAGGGLVATVTHLCSPPNVQNSSPASAVTVVVVQDPSLAPHLPGEAFAQLYCLTQAELRVALAMVPGSTPQNAAAKLGISCNTVKTHLQRIFEKTATSRQADLVALMLRTIPPVAA